MRVRGFNHLAMVTGDMEKTVRFYRDVLGMPLTLLWHIGAVLAEPTGAIRP